MNEWPCGKPAGRFLIALWFSLSEENGCRRCGGVRDVLQ
jgi:hypothetical protein